MKPHRRNLACVSMFLALSMLACNMERVLNPSLPTHTPPAATNAPGLPLPTALPTAISTPLPGARIESGDWALFIGDWDGALTAFEAARRATDERTIHAAAWLGTARAYYAAGDLAASLNALQTYFAQYGDTPERGLAFFLAGQIYESQERHAEAALAFGEYIAARPGLIDAHVYTRIGDNLLSAGDTQGALNAYLSALRAPQLGDGTALGIKIGDLYLALGDSQTALVTYQDILARTANGNTKAAMLRRIGDIHIASGDPGSAYAAYVEAVNLYPAAYDSYLALVNLLDAGQPVSELQRGLINYYVGQYGLAIAAFERYRQSNPPEQDDTVHYFSGLSYRAIGDAESAIEEWQSQIERFPDGPWFDEAWEQIGYAQRDMQQDFPAAIATFEQFAERYPQHPRSPEFLFIAGRTAERLNDLPRAAAIWQRLGSLYSTSEWGVDGLFQAGILFYRLEDYNAARDTFQGALTISQTSEQKARAYFWAGKTAAEAGNAASAQTYWAEARALDPTGYYSERAAQLLRGEPHFSIREFSPPEQNLAAERAEAESWLITTFNLPPDTNFSDLSVLESDLRFQRGNEFWRLHLYNEARLEFENLRLEILNDAAATYRLANHLIELGLYRSGIIAARQVLNLVGYDDAGTLSAPIYFNRLRFGLYYPDLVFPAATAYNFDPLFLSSVIRQESLFEGFVVSSAGARGLMQILPSTGQDIFARTGWPPGYTGADLYRPIVSVTFGADYLARQRNTFSGDLIAALAAYNGGAGNVQQWLALSNGDPDLLIEVIRFEETRNYVRSIFEQHQIYLRVYGNTP